MKDKIKELVWGDENDALYTLILHEKESSVIEENRAGKTKAVPVPDSIVEQVREQIMQLMEENPGAASSEPPRSSKVILADESIIHVPYAKMQPIMDGAWLDANCFMQSIMNQPLMGLVACPTEPPITSMMGLQGLGMMGMGDPEQMRQKHQKPSAHRNDDGTWTCGCGAGGLTARFCPECGSQAPPASWDCPNCGAKALTSKFCPECGTPMPPIA